MSGAARATKVAEMDEADLRDWDDLAKDAKRSRWSGRGITYATPSKRQLAAARRAADDRRKEIKTLF